MTLIEAAEAVLELWTAGLIADTQFMSTAGSSALLELSKAVQAEKYAVKS